MPKRYDPKQTNFDKNNLVRHSIMLEQVNCPPQMKRCNNNKKKNIIQVFRGIRIMQLHADKRQLIQTIYTTVCSPMIIGDYMPITS